MYCILKYWHITKIVSIRKIHISHQVKTGAFKSFNWMKMAFLILATISLIYLLHADHVHMVTSLQDTSGKVWKVTLEIGLFHSLFVLFLGFG
jgi:hypothetical protein